MANNTELENIWKDLLEWQTEINKKDETFNRRKPVHDQILPPVQSSTEIILDNLKPVGLKSITAKKQTTIPKTQDTTLKTRTEKAEAEKAKGNEYFAKKDYKNAINYYTKAIDLDPTVSVYYVNRAMAHLKTKNFLQAEKDCTRGIQLQPNNVKALWRRGVALVELGRIEEARNDFEKGLTIEPNNKPILDELKKLPAPKKVPEKKAAVKVQPKEEEKKRLPINVIDDTYRKEQPTIKAATPKTIPVVKTVESKNVKSVVPEKRQPVENENVAPVPEKKQQPVEPIVKKSMTPLKVNVPRTNFEFERDWKTFKARGENELYEYFQAIPPTSYAGIFKSSLESDQFEKMLEILERRYAKEKTPVDIFNVLFGLSQVKRIDMLVMFLSKKEQQILQKLFDLMKSSSDVSSEKLSKLSKVYDARV